MLRAVKGGEREFERGDVRPVIAPPTSIDIGRGECRLDISVDGRPGWNRRRDVCDVRRFAMVNGSISATRTKIGLAHVDRRECGGAYPWNS